MRFNGPVTAIARIAALTPLVCLSIASSGCGGGVPVGERIQLEGIRPRDREGVFLNEELVLTFSRPLDPGSITASSVSVSSEDGLVAHGRWLVEGRTLRFVPRPVLRPSLMDGGYQPGTRYEVELLGFPRLDGVRGKDGEPLERGIRFTFTTVSVGADRPGVVFDDMSPERAHPLLPDFSYQGGTKRAAIEAGDPIVLTCAEPIDPSSLDAEDFLLIAQRVVRELVDGVPVQVERFEDVPLTAVLRRNDPEGSSGDRPCCEIELYPPGPLEVGLNYVLHPRGVLQLIDFQGNTVLPRFSSLEMVAVPDTDTHLRRPSLPFLDPSAQLPLRVPGSDGLAHWGAGRVSVRYPAAAGDGRDGPLLEGLDLDRADWAATRIEVPATHPLRLRRGPGLRVLRAQAALSIHGQLSRASDPGVERRGPKEGENPFLPGETLSEFLARAEREAWDWTVIVAGGDLTVTGTIDVDTPLLLVAGGWIRVSGTVRHAPRQLWLMGDGGGVRDATASPTTLVLDPPRENQLVEPLELSVVSTALPPMLLEYNWHGYEAGGHTGAGAWRVQFLPRTGPIDTEAMVGHPRLLPDRGPLRVVVGLTVPSAAQQRAARGRLSWDPPFVDYVDLRWEKSD